MVFHLHKKVVTYPDLQLNGNKIERVTQFNFLGLILQSNLSWNKHVNHISLKVSKTIGTLYRLKSVYPLKVLLTLYNTLMLPYFKYCILSWGSVLKNNDHLQLLKKKATRIITNSHFIAVNTKTREHGSQSSRKLKMAPVTLKDGSHFGSRTF